MILIDTPDELRSLTAAWRRAGETIVLVPTMGSLHRGHLALVDHARSLGERVVVSIFVNPLQFGPTEDFARYPRRMEADIAALEASHTDALWRPSASLMYPSGFATSVTVSGLSDQLCGVFRPNHFSGVATVVLKLLNSVQPHIAVFGEKDFQQLQIIRQMAKDLDIPTAIVGVPTVREADGLALSSRNAYLSPEQRKIAPTIYRTLRQAAAATRSGLSAHDIETQSTAILATAGFDSVDYFTIRNANTLLPINVFDPPARIFCAAHLGSTRLIDNIEI